MAVTRKRRKDQASRRILARVESKKRTEGAPYKNGYQMFLRDASTTSVPQRPRPLPYAESACAESSRDVGDVSGTVWELCGYKRDLASDAQPFLGLHKSRCCGRRGLTPFPPRGGGGLKKKTPHFLPPQMFGPHRGADTEATTRIKIDRLF